jgi:hypothetical protein
MTRPHSAVRAQAAALLCALVMLSASARAQSNDLVGTWYGDLVVSETRGGKRVNLRRWLRVNEPGGRQTITFRFYLDGRLQEEQITHGEWGYRDKVYWTRCTSLIMNGREGPCLVTDRREYDVHTLDAREMTYTSRSSGTLFKMRRVPRDFTLP